MQNLYNLGKNNVFIKLSSFKQAVSSYLSLKMKKVFESDDPVKQNLEKRSLVIFSQPVCQTLSFIHFICPNVSLVPL